MNDGKINSRGGAPRSGVPLPGMTGVGAAAKVQEAAGELKPFVQVGKTGGSVVASSGVSGVEGMGTRPIVGASGSRTMLNVNTAQRTSSNVLGARPGAPLPGDVSAGVLVRKPGSRPLPTPPGGKPGGGVTVSSLQQEVVDLKKASADLVSMMESMQAQLTALQGAAGTVSVAEASAGVQAVLPLAEMVANLPGVPPEVRKDAAALVQTVQGGRAQGVAPGKGKAVSADVVAEQAKTIEKTKNDYKSTLQWLEVSLYQWKIWFKNSETIMDPLSAVGLNGMALTLVENLCDVGIDTSKFLRGQADFQKSRTLDKAAGAWRESAEGKADNNKELIAIAKAVKRFQSPRLMQAEAVSVLLRRLVFLGAVVLVGLCTLGVLSAAVTVGVGGGLFFGVVGVALSFATYRYARKAWRKREVAALEAADKELKAAIADGKDNPFQGAGKTVRALEKSWIDKMKQQGTDVSTMTGKDKAEAVLQVMHYKRLRIDPNYAVGVLLEKLHDETDEGRTKTWEFLQALGFTTEELKKMKDENWKVADIKTVEVDQPEGGTVEVQELPKARVELMQSKLGLIWA